ncbi:MAG TPA: nitrilase-related carbon-nitrogen hydrolase, partial [Geminicoccaceae bacterium]|nr:nitrilase-related carbon-nitrogen hydrolase [Geminicoccaceae bacterium]
MKVALIQMNSQGDKRANLAAARRLIERAVAEERPELVALPEVWPCLTEESEVRERAAEPLGDGEAYHMLRELAAAHRIHLHGGSLLERDGDRLYNTTVVFDPEGHEIARYRKIHLFDVTTPDGKQYRESNTFGRG